MSLYLCIFSGEDEVAGVEVGTYAEFNALRQAVAELEGGVPGARFPVLMLHADCEGAWSGPECAALESELATIVRELRGRPARPFASAAQAASAARRDLVPRHAGECFLDVDGAFLLDGLQQLVARARQTAQPILFQ
jgi:hypothetical protein